MLTEKDLTELWPFLIPTDFDENLDRAGVASLCRQVVEDKMFGITVKPSDIKFTWSCLEHHKKNIFVRETAPTPEIAKNLQIRLSEGCHFCEVSLKDIPALMDCDFSVAQLIPFLPYHEIKTREKATEILSTCAGFKGICLIQDQTNETQRLVQAYRLFEGVRTLPQSPHWILFDVIESKTAPLFVQNICRLKEKLVPSLSLQIAFHITPKTIKYFLQK